MPPRVHIHGRVVAPEEAQISIFDRGFLYGDSVYEVVRIYGGIPFAYEAHVDRFYASGELIGFALPWTREHVRSVVDETLTAAALGDAYMRIVGTRGGGTIGLDPALAVDPQLIVVVLDLPTLPAAMYEHGRTACLVSVQRNLKQAIDPQAKTGNYMNNVLAAADARRHHADEAIMLDHQGRVAEGSSANVFALIDGTWCTPPLEVGILSGITRATLLEALQRQGMAVAERMLWPDDLIAAEELFICSSIREIVPIVKLDDRPIGDGTVGAAVRGMHALYRAEVRRQVAAG